MKKIISLLLAAACLTAVLTACGKTADKAPENLDLEAVYQAILAAQPADQDELVMWPETMDETSYIANVYVGLPDVAMKQSVCYAAPVSGWATEVVLVEVEDSADVKTVQDIFQARIDLAKDDTSYPETAAAWQNAVIQTAGNYVGMIVLPDGYTIPEDVFSLTA